MGLGRLIQSIFLVAYLAGLCPLLAETTVPSMRASGSVIDRLQSCVDELAELARFRPNRAGVPGFPIRLDFDVAANLFSLLKQAEHQLPLANQILGELLASTIGLDGSRPPEELYAGTPYLYWTLDRMVRADADVASHLPLYCTGGNCTPEGVTGARFKHGRFQVVSRLSSRAPSRMESVNVSDYLNHLELVVTAGPQDPISESPVKDWVIDMVGATSASVARGKLAEAFISSQSQQSHEGPLSRFLSLNEKGVLEVEETFYRLFVAFVRAQSEADAHLGLYKSPNTGRDEAIFKNFIADTSAEGRRALLHAFSSTTDGFNLSEFMRIGNLIHAEVMCWTASPEAFAAGMLYGNGSHEALRLRASFLDGLDLDRLRAIADGKESVKRFRNGPHEDWSTLWTPAAQAWGPFIAAREAETSASFTLNQTLPSIKIPAADQPMSEKKEIGTFLVKARESLVQYIEDLEAIGTELHRDWNDILNNPNSASSLQLLQARQLFRNLVETQSLRANEMEQLWAFFKSRDIVATPDIVNFMNWLEKRKTNPEELFFLPRALSRAQRAQLELYRAAITTTDR